PNRWTFEGSEAKSDWLVLELGAKRALHTAKLYFLEDGPAVGPPESFTVEAWDGEAWKVVSEISRAPKGPEGRRANTVRFKEVTTDRLRFTFIHKGRSRTGLSEVEAWGDAKLPVTAPPFPTDNLAYNASGKGFPKVNASHTSRFDKAAH